MDEISDRLALVLSRRGIGVGSTVALLSDRNPALVFAMLGVLKSGAAFFVADSSYPAARIRDCLALANPSLLILCGDAVSADARDGLETLRLPAGQSAAMKSLPASDRDVAPAPTSSDWPAYIGFTSGSTGKPKAIITAHAPLCHFIEWHTRRHHLGRDDRFSLLSGLGHDPALRDIFTPLSIGASLHIPEPGLLLDPTRLSDWVADHGITVLHLTPALGQVIASGTEDRIALTLLRHLFWGGDVLGPKLARAFRGIAPNAAQVRFYGTTETPQAMAFSVVEPDEAGEGHTLGRGIDDAQLLVVREMDRLADVGEVGEILVRSPYLSLGYLGDPELTRSRYVANPFTGDDADRCYRTGDLGTYSQVGEVFFVGRSDDQLKIRGFRVEPAEVAARIEKLPGVARAVAMGRDLGRDSKTLVAYFVCERGVDVRGDEIRDALREALPSYMVPAQVVRLDRFPLLASGKIDLLSLPSPVFESGSEGVPDPALTDRERALVETWKEVLGLERVALNESFADMGGDSLSAIRALMRLRRLGVPEAQARGVLQGKTIAQIAREEESNGPASPQPPPTGAARTGLMVNNLRGALVVIVVMAHWLPSLLKRLPPWLGDTDSVIMAIMPALNVVTPGFAFVFGISLGYFFFPRYRHDPANVRRTLRFGVWLIAAALTLRATSTLVLELTRRGVTPAAPTRAPIGWVPLVFGGGEVQGPPFEDFAGDGRGVLLYYVLALATAPAWINLVARAGRPVVACLGLMAASYAAHRVSLALLLDRPQVGVLDVLRLILCAKYAFFNMLTGSIGGLTVGLYLWERRRDTRLWARLLPLGTSFVAAGLALLWAGTGHLHGLYATADMAPWRWVFYSGVVVVVAAMIDLVLGRFASLPRALQVALQLGGVLGQCSLPIFVLHGMVTELKAMLDVAGSPPPVSTAVALLAFACACGLAIGSIYRAYYGRLRLDRA